MNKINKQKPADKLVKDPVCGMVKTKSQMRAQAVYKGKTYYFCVEADKQLFVGHPSHWITKQDKGGDS